jgi:predicted enzyme related to lactoylglutathione lyase
LSDTDEVGWGKSHPTQTQPTKIVEREELIPAGVIVVVMFMRKNSTDATLDTVIICTTRMRELAEFYKFGLQLQEPKSQGDNHLGFQLQEIYLGFDKMDEDQFIHPGAVSLWFRVDNIEETFGRFKELGAKVKYPPTKKPWGDILAAVYDLDSNIVGLAQR